LISNVESFLHACNKTNLIMLCGIFNVLLNSFTKYFIENFSVYIHQRNWFVNFYFVVSLQSFGIRLK
jgi:hypothetical protein